MLCNLLKFVFNHILTKKLHFISLMVACKKDKLLKSLSEGLKQFQGSLKLQAGDVTEGGTSSKTMKILNTKPVQLLKIAVLKRNSQLTSKLFPFERFL